MARSDLQQIVFNKARDAMKNENWYKGVCVDNFPSDADILRNGINESVSAVIFETELWDNPDMP